MMKTPLFCLINYKIKTGKKYQTVDRERCQKYGTKAENMSNPAEETTQTV